MRVLLAGLALFFGCVCFAAVTPSRADTFAFVPQNNGTIARFRADDRTGKLISLPGGATDTGIHRPITLVLSQNRRFLYVYRTLDAALDGYTMEDLPGKDALVRTAPYKPSPLLVFALLPGGELRRVQGLTVPGPIGQITSHPGGQFLYALSAHGAFILKITRAPEAGHLIYAGQAAVGSGLNLEDGAGLWGGADLTFSPSGRYLYDFFSSGFEDQGVATLQRYQINATTGKAKESGAAWSNGSFDTEEKRRKPTPPSCPVWCFVNRTAFLTSGDAFTVCRVDNDRILWRGSRIGLKPAHKSQFGYNVCLMPHPTRPLVYYRGSFSDPYTSWRVVAPGKLRPVGAFASAFGLTVARAQRIVISPSGRFLYETASSEGVVVAPAVAVYTLSPNGTRAKLSVPPRPLPFGSDVNLILADTPPAKKQASPKR